MQSCCDKIFRLNFAPDKNKDTEPDILIKETMGWAIFLFGLRHLAAIDVIKK